MQKTTNDQNIKSYKIRKKILLGEMTCCKTWRKVINLHRDISAFLP